MCARSANEEDGPTPGWPDDGAARPGRAARGKAVGGPDRRAARTRRPETARGTSSEAGSCPAAQRRRRPRQKPDLAPPSTGSITPVRYDAAGESMNAAVRPNSSGVP